MLGSNQQNNVAFPTIWRGYFLFDTTRKKLEYSGSITTIPIGDDKEMDLKEIPFGRVFAASGVQGFFGEGYWFHDPLKHFGLDFDNTTFVAKTTTLKPRPGNMPLQSDFTPRERMPECIHARPLRGVALNAIGLSGPGAEVLFKTGRWQKRVDPFFISFMSTAASRSERNEELIEFVKLFEFYLPDFYAPVGLQINYSCPNVGLHVDELLQEVEAGLLVASLLDIPLMPKFNVMLPVEAAREIGNHPLCDALCISNTIPYGQLPDKIDWQKLFGSVSPLEKFGGGGLSGKPLLPLVLDWLERVRSIGFDKPINAGGGILSVADGEKVLQAGADSIFLGSVAFMRPWRVRGIVKALGV